MLFKLLRAQGLSSESILHQNTLNKIGPCQDRKKLMRMLFKKPGVRYFRFQPLRHGGASVIERNNVPIGTIQRILGHEKRTTTEIYLHSIGNAEREAMAVFASARARKSHTDPHMGADASPEPEMTVGASG